MFWCVFVFNKPLNITIASTLRNDQKQIKTRCDEDRLLNKVLDNFFLSILISSVTTIPLRFKDFNVFLNWFVLSNLQCQKKIKSSLYNTCRIVPKPDTSVGTNLRGLEPGQHNSGETWQRWRAVGDAASDLIGPGIESETYRTNSDDLASSRLIFSKFESMDYVYLT